MVNGLASGQTLASRSGSGAVSGSGAFGEGRARATPTTTRAAASDGEIHRVRRLPDWAVMIARSDPAAPTGHPDAVAPHSTHASIGCRAPTRPSPSLPSRSRTAVRLLPRGAVSGLNATLGRDSPPSHFVGRQWTRDPPRCVTTKEVHQLFAIIDLAASGEPSQMSTADGRPPSPPSAYRGKDLDPWPSADRCRKGTRATLIATGRSIDWRTGAHGVRWHPSRGSMPGRPARGTGRHPQ